MTKSLRLAYVRAFINQDITHLEDHTPSAVVTDIFSETSALHMGFSDTTGIVIQSISKLIISLAMAFTRSWKLAYAVGISIIALFTFVWSTNRIQARLGTLMTRILSQPAGLLEEGLVSIIEIIVFNARGKLLRKYEVLHEQIKDAAIRKSPAADAELGFTRFSLLSAYALALWFGTHLLSDGSLLSGGRIVMHVICSLLV